MRAAALACLLATAVAADRHVLYSRTASHAEWTKGVRAESTAPVSFTVAVRQQNLDVLEEKFWAVSTPGSAEYQQFLTPEEIADIVRSDEADMLAVKEWLVSAEGASCTVHADAFACKAPVSTVEQLFNTEMYVFTNMMDGVKIVRHWGDMSIPAGIKPAVDMITGFSHFPEARYGRSGPVNDVDYYVVPETIVNFYGLDGISGSSKSIQSVAEFQSYPPYSQSDLDTFETNTGIQHFDVVKKIGPFNPSYPAAESTLDIQYIGAVGAGNSNWYWTTPDWMYEFSLQLSTMTDAPMVISMSYGWDEAQQCKISPNICAQQGFDSEGFVKRVNTEFQKIGARGVSLLASSGDAGSHGRTDEQCQSPTLNPTFPAASPYLTAVGATQIKNGKSENAKAPVCQQIQCATGGTEIVASHGTGALVTSGGGFSGYAPRPAYQDAVVSAYLKNSSVVPSSSDFNAAGRGYPDVAALGHKYYIELGGQIQAVDGTSASSPVFAGVVGLLNGYLLENGKKQLGFLNPFLYKMAADQPSTFNDITSGSNKCTEYTCCQTGFTATTGWDAASGLGSPQAGEMIKYLQSQFNIEATTTGLRGAAQ